MESLNPWEEENSPFKTQASFFSWVRGNLRKMWKNYPLKNNFIQSKRYAEPVGRYKTGSKAGQVKTQWHADCAQCGSKTPITHMQVDHITPAGSLKDFQDISGFVERMLCSTEGMQYVCIPCHKVITHADKKGLTLEAAEIDLEAIKWTKAATSDQLEILLKHYPQKDVSNATKRKAAFFDLISKDLI